MNDHILALHLPPMPPPITSESVRTASLYPLKTLEERTAGTARLLVTRYWPRGLKRERIDEWLMGWAPSPGLLKAYRHGVSWETFATVFGREVTVPRRQIEALRSVGTDLIRQYGVITLLCYEQCPRDGHDESNIRCHRRLLRDLLTNEVEWCEECRALLPCQHVREHEVAAEIGMGQVMGALTSSGQLSEVKS